MLSFLLKSDSFDFESLNDCCSHSLSFYKHLNGHMERPGFSCWTGTSYFPYFCILMRFVYFLRFFSLTHNANLCLNILFSLTYKKSVFIQTTAYLNDQYILIFVCIKRGQSRFYTRHIKVLNYASHFQHSYFYIGLKCKQF